jgi:hypothetical protein
LEFFVVVFFDIELERLLILDLVLELKVESGDEDPT